MSKRQEYSIGNREHAPKPYHYQECGLPNVYLINGFEIEEHDGEEYVSIENVQGLWKAIGLNLVTKKKTFDPEVIKFLRTQMDFTQAELATHLRVDDQTVARWEKGKSKTIPGPADIALRSLYLSSDVAQPEGKEILQYWIKMISELVGSDSINGEDLLFSNDSKEWNLQAA
jgi:DNA-binding transcriptional regulator YiaG